MARHRVADGGTALPVWRVAANILKSSRGQPKGGGPLGWEFGEVLTTPHHRNVSFYETFIE